MVTSSRNVGSHKLDFAALSSSVLLIKWNISHLCGTSTLQKNINLCQEEVCTQSRCERHPPPPTPPIPVICWSVHMVGNAWRPFIVTGKDLLDCDKCCGCLRCSLYVFIYRVRMWHNCCSSVCWQNAPGTAVTAHSEVPLVLCLMLSDTHLVGRQCQMMKTRFQKVTDSVSSKFDLWKISASLFLEGEGEKKKVLDRNEWIRPHFWTKTEKAMALSATMVLK